jgi:hypothetical protein
MLFLTSKGKSEVNRKAINQSIAEPYTSVTAAGALTLKVTKPSSDPSGRSEDKVTTQFVSDDVKQQAEQDVKRYYERLDEYESIEIDRFLQNPMGYTPDVPPTKPTLLDEFLKVNPDKRDGIIEKLFKRLGEEGSVTKNYDMLLAVISVDSKGVTTLQVYYYSSYDLFYNITGEIGRPGIQFVDPTLHGFTEYMRSNPNSTFLFIKKNNLNYSGCTIGRCFYLSETLKTLHSTLTKQKQQLESDISKLNAEISTLTATLDANIQNLTNRRKSDAYRDTSVIGKFSTTSVLGRLLSTSSSEYNQFKVKLEREIDEIKGKIEEKKQNLKSLQLKLGTISTQLINDMQLHNTSIQIKEYNKISFNFSLDSVVKFCQPSSGAIAAAGGGNRNNLRVSKLKKILTKKSRKRPTKKSRKRPTKKSRKRPTKKSHKRPTKKSRKH